MAIRKRLDKKSNFKTTRDKSPKSFTKKDSRENFDRKKTSKPSFRSRREELPDSGRPVKSASSDFKTEKRFGENKTRKYSAGHSRNKDTQARGFVRKDDEQRERPKIGRPSFSREPRKTFSTRESGTTRPKFFDEKESLGKDFRAEDTKPRFKKPIAGKFDKRRTNFDHSDKQKRISEPRKTSTELKVMKKEKFERRNKKEVEQRETVGSDNIRLNRYISNAGICSRREADKLITTGLVSVNGKIITEMGYQVKQTDDVRFNGERLSREKKVYLIMNKPKDAITTLDDPEGRNTVLDVLGKDLKERVFPIGRLDRNTTGVLLFTNDGEVATRLMHPKYEVEKVYKATLNKTLKGEDFWQISNGVDLEDGFIKPDEIAYPDQKNKTVVGIQIHSGRNRIIHRIFEHMDYVVEKLDRVSYGGFVKTGLKRGESRMMDDKEIKMLKRLVKLA